MFTLQSKNKTYRVAEKRSGSSGSYYIQHFNSSLDRPLKNSLARDLVMIGQGVFMGDRAFRRGIAPGRQTRSIRVVIEVENADFWLSIKDQLESMAHFVSRDWWTLEFRQKGKQKEIVWNNNGSRYDAISLFSDGLDSLVGAASLLRTGCKTLFVLHEQKRWNYKQAEQRVQRIGVELKRIKVPAGIAGFQFEITDKDKSGKRNLFPENSRRTRPFLYLCLAGAAAIEYKVPDIYMNENGPLAINLPLNRGKVGAPYISRHAHPNTLLLFERILWSVWSKYLPKEKRPSLQNPFLDDTKSETVARIRELGISDTLILETISCENAGRVLASIKGIFKDGNKKRNIRDIKECGMCMPCLIKRYSLLANKIDIGKDHFALNRYDPSDRSVDPRLKDKFNNLLRQNSALKAELEDFCKKIISLSSRKFITEYIYELSSLLDTGTGDLPIKGAERIHDTLRRFATQYLAVLKKGKDGK